MKLYEKRNSTAYHTQTTDISRQTSQRFINQSNTVFVPPPPLSPTPTVTQLKSFNIMPIYHRDIYVTQYFSLLIFSFLSFNLLFNISNFSDIISFDIIHKRLRRSDCSCFSRCTPDIALAEIAVDTFPVHKAYTWRFQTVDTFPVGKPLKKMIT